MNTQKAAQWLDRFLDAESFAGNDPSKNGLQVDNGGREIGKVAFAVDACLETIERSVKAGADLLVVHHGLFWRDCELVVRGHYRRLKALLDGGLALYAAHLPLDAHPEVGNNACIARRLGLEELMPFGEYRGKVIGFRGVLPSSLSVDALHRLLDPEKSMPVRLLAFGPREIRTVGVVSGGGADEVHEALALGLDCFVTGEIGHEEYHHALENGIHVIAAGHYATETFGPRELMARFSRETGIDSVFVDVPTGL